MQGNSGNANIENRLMDVGSGEEEEGGMNGQSMETYTLPYVKEIANGNLLCGAGNLNLGSVTT